MRRISTQNIVEGMKLAKTIYSSDARVLLGKGVELHSQYKQRLLDLDIISIYIEDNPSYGIEVQDVISESTRIKAIKAVRNIVHNYTLSQTVDTRPVREIINVIVDDLFYAKDIVINMVDLRAKSDYTFCHMVNVTVLSVITGISLGYDELQLRDLGVGALLHDIGKIKIDENIYNKPDVLTDDEYQEVKRHAEQGFEILRKVECLNVICAHVAFQHHERFDGQGYPRRLKGEDIHEYARIVALADVFDALTASRPYRKAMMPYHAVEYLVAMGGRQFDPKLTQLFIDHIAIYPVGSMVELNTREKAIVVAVNKEHKTRPLVRVLTDAQSQMLNEFLEVDLMTNPTLFINNIIEE
jgi:HD-GYP domain-containing protein (c-di-GMP phosphodiesterase class II)